MSKGSASCEFVLAYFNGDTLPKWKLGLADEAEFLIGGDVDGPGRLALPGIAAIHVKVWRSRTGVWLQAGPGAKTWLNGLPLFTGPVSLVKGLAPLKTASRLRTASRSSVQPNTRSSPGSDEG